VLRFPPTRLSRLNSTETVKNNSAKKGSFVAAAFCECAMNFNLMVSMDREPITVSLAFGVLVKFIMEISQIGVDTVQ
jgi:hypothetical protein